MGFLDGLSNIFHGIGHLFGGGDEEDQKKKQQQQSPAPSLRVAPTQSSQSDNQPLTVAKTPDNNNNIGLVQSNQLVKANQPPAANPPPAAPPAPSTTLTKAPLSPAQQRAQAFVDSHGGPVDPNYTSHNPGIGSMALEAAKGIGHDLADPAVRNYQQLQKEQAQHRADASPGVAGNLIATAKDTGSFIKTIGKTGLEYAGYAAPEIKGLKAAAEAPALVKAGIGLLAHGGTSAPLAVAGSLASGERDPVKIAENAALQTLGAGAGGLLKKPVTPEIAPGIKSTNPDQAIHAAQQLEKANPAPPPEPPLPAILPTAMNEHETAALTQLNKDAKTRVLTNDENATRQALQIKAEGIDAVNNPAPVTPEAAPSVAPAAEPAVAPVAPAVETATPPVAATEVAPPAATIQGVPVPGEAGLPHLPEPGNPQQIEAAPNMYQQIVKQIGGDKNLKGNQPLNDKINLDELKQHAAGVVANMSDDHLLNAVASTSRDALAHDPQSFSLARATLDRLYTMAKDGKNELANQQVGDVLDAMSKYASKSAQGLRTVQEEFDHMPLPMKVRYLAKKIDAANADTKGYEPLARDPAKMAAVEAQLTSHLEVSQSIADHISAIQDQLSQIAEGNKGGVLSGADVGALTKEVANAVNKLQINNGELVKYFQGLVPGRTGAQKTLVDFPKRMMLGSFSGRLNDVATTAANVAHLGTENFTQSIVSRIASALHLVKADSLTHGEVGATKVAKGVLPGFKKSVGEARGNQYVTDIQGAIKDGQDLRSGLRKPGGPVGRTIQAATELATNITKGVGDQRVAQLAEREARQLKIPKGELRDQYVATRSAVPSREMQAQAQELHHQINNLNNNFISKALNDVGKAMEGNNTKFAKSGIGGLIKNQIIPFTSWLGGNIFNTITDKNAIASTYKFGRDVIKGDPEGAVRNLSKAINGAVQGYVIGYQMAKAGMITDQNAEGFNDGGSYFHIGDRYIPVGQLGFFAPNIVLGQAAYKGLNAPPGKNPAEEIAGTIGSYGWHGLALGNVLGTNSNVTKAVNAGTAKGGGFTDAAAVAGAGVAGQYIPGVTGDINSILDQTPLNPTHEKANTRIQSTDLTAGGKPSKAKDVAASALAGLEARIPGLEQTMPRKAGVAAPDFLDRTVHGDRETQTQKDAAAKTKSDAQIAADWKARDIPNYKEANFDNKVKARFENGEYDKAMEAQSAKIAADSANRDIPKSALQAEKDKLTLYKVHKDGKFDSALVDKYKGTSLSEWRNMGDPESDTYDPTAYQKMYEYDTALAKAGISGSSLSKSDNKYLAKKPGKGRGSGAGHTAGGGIGSLEQLKKTDFGNLTPQKIANAKIPTIQAVKAGDLIKKRTISVGKVT